MRKFTSLLLLGFALGSFAQTPGGVSGSELWFKTAPLNSDLQGYYRWQDFSGDSIRLMLLDSRGVKSELTLPNSSVHYFNFNPSLWLADGFRSLSASLKHGDLSQATVIGVFAPELATIGKDMVVYALDGRKGDGAILSKDKAVRGRGVEPLDYGSASGEDLLYQSSDSLSENGFKESALRVVSYFKVSNPSTTLWGDNSNTTLFIGTPSSSGSFGTDFPTSLFGNASIRGYAPELIVFSRMLTPDERRKVESYLAVKYGITLKGSYLDSDGNLTWDMAENQAYHHRVTAVGTDTAGNVTTSTYDMGDRRTEVNHPASGITNFTYDALGNVLTKQTANLAKEGKFITYDYDYQRLTGINYPDHPENNVKYYYGGRNASQNRIGRLMLREDGTGAIEYFYGKMGEVTKTRRTMIVPNQAIATYVTQWTYDSHNRLLEMIYPDEEKITYSYNLGGQLEKVHGYKSYGYDYVSKIGYDKFEQRTYLKYCNGAETFYTYDPQRRRLQNLMVNSGGNTIMDNAYTYDAVSNVLSVINGASVPKSGKAGGQMAHTYTYDALYRLVSATGTYTGADNKTASYTLAMGYDNMHRITSKRQILTQNNVQFNGTLNAGYDLSYTYGTDTGKKFQLANVKDVNYRTEETPSESENVNNNHAYEYDANGNLVYVNTSRTKKDGVSDEKTTERKLKWDEENRLLASDDNGFVTNYWYDADGERTVKTSGESDQVYVNSEFAGGRTNTAKFSLYVSPYLVANQGGRYTLL